MTIRMIQNDVSVMQVRNKKADMKSAFLLQV